MSVVQGAKERVDMVSPRVLLVNLDNCIRCHACDIACQQEHGLTYETRSRWCQVVTIGPKRICGALHTDFVPVICFQCDDPFCAYFCPSHAISKTRDGLVLVDEALCSGCKQCVYACPYGAIFYNEIQGKVGKCDLCNDRIRNDLEPACVQHCIGGALQWVTTEDLNIIIQKEYTLRIGMVYYVSGKWELERGKEIP
jgi:Fe-S-cluster-containing dehydrogenase component